MMRLFFSEYKSDYSNYIFPYAVWAMPDAGESPAHMFARGFLPNSRNLERFYLCRQVRVQLHKFQPSSENRRVMRKGEGIQHRLIPRNEFEYSRQWQQFCKNYADQKFGQDVMSTERLDNLFQSRIVSHLMIFSDASTLRDIGLVMLYLEQPALAFYYYSFYDLDYFSRNLGMIMMTETVNDMKDRGLEYIYLGSCYSRNALYKIQFEGFEFFNGFCWSDNPDELKYLIQRDSEPVSKHLLESDEYLSEFYPQGFADSPMMQFPIE